jgi:hypothetical protein
MMAKLEEAAAPGDDSEQQPGSSSSPGTVISSSTDQNPILEVTDEQTIRDIFGLTSASARHLRRYPESLRLAYFIRRGRRRTAETCAGWTGSV